MSTKMHSCFSLLYVGATQCLASLAAFKAQHGYCEFLSIRKKSLPRSVIVVFGRGSEILDNNYTKVLRSDSGEKNPSIQAALLQHLRHAAYQIGYV